MRASSVIAALCGCVILLPNVGLAAADDPAGESAWPDILASLPAWAWFIAFIAASMAVLTAMAINAVDYTDVFPDD